jgi:murein DD-endopeptidase MepM/ murein hydrolase activator NlpD
VRTFLLAAALSLMVPVHRGAQARTARTPWLLFPLDVRRFDRVSSKFGMRKLHGPRAVPRGVDLVAPRGSLVVAAREGRVADTGRARACGWYVTVEHENSWRTVYCHLRSDPRRLGIVEGLRVPAMGVVGEVGSTGHSTGPHLHFTLLDGRGQARDPLLALYTPAETLEVLKRMGLAR